MYLKSKIIFLVASLMMFFGSNSGVSQTIGGKYELEFSNIASCNPSWFAFRNNVGFLDDKQNIRQGKPAFKLFYKDVAQGKSMKFNLSKTIILPYNLSQKECKISIISKDDVKHDLWFKVIGLDIDEHETDAKLVKINSKSWQESSVKIKMHRTKAISINMYYEGDKSNEQHIWIDRILIGAAGNDITRHNYFSENLKDSLKTIKSLSEKYLTPLATGNDSTLLLGIKELDGKRIIGIGECTHGSSTVREANYQFIKNLIVNHRCRQVLLEVPIETTLMWNLYIQGRIAKNYRTQIQDDVKCSVTDYGLLMQFLDWLRLYNMVHPASQVYLSGVDNPNSWGANLYLFNFYLTLLGKERASFYLRKTAEEKYADILTHTQRDTALRDCLGKENFECYLSFLKNDMILHQKSDEYSDDRDSNMSIRVNRIMNICTKAGEKTAILAHSGHLQKLNRNYLKKDIPLGFYLRKTYGDQYFSISFQIGRGSFTQDECTGSQMITATLPAPPLNSFEYAGSATGLPYFFYLSNNLGDGILACCFIPRNSRYNDLYKFFSLKREFDAYVFIKESIPIEKIEPNISSYAFNYYYDRKMAMDSILSAIGN